MGVIAEAAGGIVGDISGGMGAGGDADIRAQQKRNAEIAAAGGEDIDAALGGFADTGEAAMGKALRMSKKGFSFGAKDFQQDPGYKFALQQGLQATQNAAGVRGSPFGGQAQSAMTQTAVGMAGQQYQQQYSNAFNRWQSQVGNLQQLAGLGAGAAGGIASGKAGLAQAEMGGGTSMTQTGVQTKGSFMDYF